MHDVPCVSIEDARKHYTDSSAVFVDIRDQLSIDEASIPGRRILNNENAASFVEEVPKDQPIIVYCYHGNSSKMATAYLLEQGYEKVWSMDGGFEEWRVRFAD